MIDPDSPVYAKKLDDSYQLSFEPITNDEVIALGYGGLAGMGVGIGEFFVANPPVLHNVIGSVENEFLPGVSQMSSAPKRENLGNQAIDIIGGLTLAGSVLFASIAHVKRRMAHRKQNNAYVDEGMDMFEGLLAMHSKSKETKD